MSNVERTSTARHRATPTVIPTVAAPLFAAMPPAVQTVLRLCDGFRTPTDIATLSGLPRATLVKVLRRLADAGVVTAAPDKARRPLSRDAREWVDWRPPEEVARPAPAVEAAPAVEVAPAPVEVVAAPVEGVAAPVEVVAAPIEVVAVEPAPAPAIVVAPEPAFSDDEESFFSSSYEHLSEHLYE